MIFIIEIIVNLRNLVYINHSQMENLWKNIELNEEQVKFLTWQGLYVNKYAKLFLQYYIVIEIISITEIEWLSLIEI